MNVRTVIYYLVIGAIVGLLIGNILRDPIIGLVVGVALALLGLLLRNRGPVAIGGGRRTYQELLSRARGDEALVERLIKYEQTRNPDASRDKWVRDALDRWERDR